ncbi:hypothetical protein Cgig2_023337 [Carnegiea gigantea]|uniref:Uncharacterized protein n=1 Tax=Carnegiea gigantea TaxID=171969 RepID=A0A9Q1K323_9CARY|nr:hypothetical protein Cgig2_023337 [Carnegiea gigantea]
MNYKEKLAHVPLPSGNHCFSSTTPRVFVPQAMILKLSPPPRQILHECPLYYALQELRKIEANKSGAWTTDHVILNKDLINERGGDATPLMSKVERLIHQACDLKDWQESYSDRMTTELDTGSTHCNVLKAKLGQVESRREKLLKELQSLDVKRRTSVVKWWLAERAVIGLEGQINTLNTIVVTDPTTNAYMEKTEAYVKESFEDLKTFQWTPCVFFSDIDSLYA